LGIYSEVVSTFSGKRLAGYTSTVISLLAISTISLMVWLHHFFTMGAGANVNAFFGIMTMIIAVPTGVKIFNWLFTMYRGRIRLTTPMLWFIGFVIIFTTGGVTGVLMSIPPIDFQVHNSLFLIAHFHSMVIGGVVFGFFAGLTYWFPKIFGFRLSETLGKYAFGCWFGGFLLAFMPLYALGLMGATRRLDSYDSNLGWQGLFIVAGVGVLIIMTGLLLQIIQLAYSIYKRDELRDNTGDPWDGRTLEWSTASPAPVYNFAVIPKVSSRDSFWELKNSKDKQKTTKYENIHLPKNSSVGLIIGMLALSGGFGVVWHIWWLAVVCLIGIFASVIKRTLDQDNEYVISAKEVQQAEASKA
jgi:cytochrome o ubiquinol oxidase subunit 1